MRQQYSLEEVLAQRSAPQSQATNLVPEHLLRRTVEVPSAKWRMQSDWSARVRATSDHHSRAFKSLLNKLAPSNLERIQAKLLLEVTEATSPCLAELLLEKGIGEQKFGAAYAQLCQQVTEAREYFKKDFLTACQVLFEGLVEGTPERARLLASVNFVGHLINSKAIPAKVLKICCDMMLEQRSELCFEGLCHLLGTCNWAFAHPRLKADVRRYIGLLTQTQEEFSSITKFKVRDLVETQSLAVLENLR